MQRAVTVSSRGTVGRAAAVRTAAALLIPAAAACHQYRTVPAAALTPPAAVWIQYDSPREVSIRSGGEAAVRPQVSDLMGRVVARRGDSIEVQLRGVARAGGRPVALAPGTVVAVPLDTAAIRARRFAPGRTALAVLGGLGAAAVALFVACGEFCR